METKNQSIIIHPKMQSTIPVIPFDAIEFASDPMLKYILSNNANGIQKILSLNDTESRYYAWNHINQSDYTIVIIAFQTEAQNAWQFMESDLNQTYNTVLWFVWIIGIGVIIGAIFIGLRVAKIISLPIDRLQKLAKKMVVDKMRTGSIPQQKMENIKNTSDELLELTGAFEHLIDKLNHNKRIDSQAIQTEHLTLEKPTEIQYCEYCGTILSQAIITQLSQDMRVKCNVCRSILKI
jgi:methyl-accepting chemotaxis protein